MAVKRHLAWAAALAVLSTSATASEMGPPRPGPRCLPGAYDGGQMEIAAGLELGADHRFRYMLSYGALDESAEGRWENEGGSLFLTSDPVTPPSFSLVSRYEGASGRIRVELDVPAGISRQYFSALVRFSDGRSAMRQFQDDGLTVELAPDERPVSLTLLLSVLAVESQAFELSGSGGELRLRFDPNDLGKVAFARTPLRIDRDDLLLERHERLIRFRRLGECESSGH